MAFIRHRQVNGATYYSLVESVRENGKVRQRVIVSLGQCATIDEAIEVESDGLAYWQDRANWGRQHRTNGRYMITNLNSGGLWSAPVGEPAQLRADNCEKKLRLLREFRDVVAKGGA